MLNAESCWAGEVGGDATSSSLHHPLHSHTDYFAYYTYFAIYIPTLFAIPTIPTFTFDIYYACNSNTICVQFSLSSLNHRHALSMHMIFATSWKHTEPHLPFDARCTHRVHTAKESGHAAAQVSNRKRAGWEPHCCCHFRLLSSQDRKRLLRLIMDP